MSLPDFPDDLVPGATILAPAGPPTSTFSNPIPTLEFNIVRIERLAAEAYLEFGEDSLTDTAAAFDLIRESRNWSILVRPPANTPDPWLYALIKFREHLFDWHSRLTIITANDTQRTFFLAAAKAFAQSVNTIPFDLTTPD